jgi:hypothetical protein
MLVALAAIAMALFATVFESGGLGSSSMVYFSPVVGNWIEQFRWMSPGWPRVRSA